MTFVGVVAVTLRILPDGPDVDLTKLSGSVRTALGPRLKKLESQPIAFGLTALVATVLVDDDSGGAEAIEAKLARLPGVSTAETTDVSLV